MKRSRADVLQTVVVVVENRARETTLAVAKSYHLLQIYSLVDGPSYCETTDLLTQLSPDEVLLHSSSCQGTSRSLMCRKIEEWQQAQQSEQQPEIVPVSRAYFDQDRGAEFLRRVSTSKLDGDILANYTVLGAGYALLKFLESRNGLIYPRASVNIHFVNHNAADFLMIDRRTASSLEIVHNIRSGDQRNCLFGVINRTKTAVGARFLRQQLLRPSADPATIKARQQAALFLSDNDETLAAVVEQLKRVPDLDVMLNRLVGMQAGKRDARVVGANIKTIIMLKQALSVLMEIARILGSSDGDGSTTNASALGDADDGYGLGEDTASNDDALFDGLQTPELITAVATNLFPACGTSIMERIKAVLTEGTHFTRSTLGSAHQECFAIKVGQDGMLDVARKTYLQTVEEIYAEAQSLADEHEIDLQVHFTAARGYHLKLPADISALPDAFIQCVKSPRFIACTTKDIASLSDRSQEAITEALVITDRITMTMCEWLQQHLTELFAQAEATAMLDMLVSFADLVLSSPREWCCPVIRDGGPLVIKEGRHPIMAELSSSEHQCKVMVQRDAESLARTPGGESSHGGEVGFVPNDTFVDDMTSLHVVSGVNGSGKTTYLKQVGLMVILAQVGCFVPAHEAFVPLRLRLLSRIGSGDDIENNLSTFLMEMKDAAYIVRNCSEDSKCLVLMDELGRGTSNADGSAIAWSVAEELANKKGTISLFVTHYPLLLNLAMIYPSSCKNVHMSIDVSEGKFKAYRHTLSDGASVVETDYGIDLAERIGIGANIIATARATKVQIGAVSPKGVDFSAVQDSEGGITGKSAAAGLVADLGKTAKQLHLLRRRLVSLKGASLDDATFARHLDRMKEQIAASSPGILERLRSALAQPAAVEWF